MGHLPYGGRPNPHPFQSICAHIIFINTHRKFPLCEEAVLWNCAYRTILSLRSWEAERFPCVRLFNIGHMNGQHPGPSNPIEAGIPPQRAGIPAHAPCTWQGDRRFLRSALPWRILHKGDAQLHWHIAGYRHSGLRYIFGRKSNRDSEFPLLPHGENNADSQREYNSPPQ